MPFKRIGLNQGLSQITLWDIAEDRQGYMWFATEDGLNRFDGQDFKVWYSGTDSQSLYHSWIWEVEEGPDGNIWIATYEGLNKWNPKLEKMSRIPSGDQAGQIRGKRTGCVMTDRKNRLWLATWGTGIHQKAPDSDDFYLSELQGDSLTKLASRFVYEMREGPKGDLWLASHYGLLRYNPSSKQIFLVQTPFQNKIPSPSAIYDMAFDAKGRLWMVTEDRGAYIYDPEEDSSSEIILKALGNKIKRLNSVMVAQNGNVWFGTTASGLFIYNVHSGKITHHRHQPSNANSLAGNWLTRIYQDRSGGIWIGSKGINYLAPSQRGIRLYRGTTSSKGGLLNNNVWSFSENPNGTVWVATENAGLHLYDPKTECLTPYPAHHPTISEINTGAITMGKPGELWVSSFQHGLFCFYTKSGKWQSYQQIYGQPFPDAYAQIHDLVWRNDKLYLGVYDMGIIEMDPRSGKLIQLKLHFEEPLKVSPYYSKVFHLAESDRIYVGTWGGGFYRWIPSTNSAKQYTQEKDGLLSNTVYALAETDRRLWIGTDRGIQWMNISDDTFHQVDHPRLKNQVIYSLIPYGPEWLWFSTNQGIFRYHIATGDLAQWDADDGLQGREFNKGSFLKSRNGLLFFGGSDGFNIIDPMLLRPDTVPPRVFIDDLLINNQSRAGLLSSEKIQLPYQQNFVSFSFYAVHHDQPDKVTYSYRLSNVDEDWVDAGDRTFVSYTQLPPDDYTFEVKAYNREGISSINTVSFPFSITPPFWQTYWFMFLVISLLVALLYALHRFRLQKALAVERLRTRIAADLHDDVGGTLTKISMYSDLLQTENQMESQQSYLASIGQMSRDIVTTMSDIVWAIETRYDRMSDLITRMKNFAYDLLGSKDIAVEFTVEETVDKKITGHLRHNLYLIFKEAINNIYRHAKATKVQIDLRTFDNEVQFIIRDNGIGLTENAKKHGNGLKNMKSRASAIHGTLLIENHEGTSISLRAKLK